MEFNQEELEEKLRGAEIFQGVRFNPDKGIAFAPRNTIQLGKQKDWNSFQGNGLVIATYLPKGAENLANVGKSNFKSGWVNGIENNNQIEKRVSALDSDWYFDGRLYVNGLNWGDINLGHAFGVE